MVQQAPPEDSCELTGIQEIQNIVLQWKNLIPVIDEASFLSAPLKKLTFQTNLYFVM
jgi:hypothetical protein